MTSNNRQQQYEHISSDGQAQKAASTHGDLVAFPGHVSTSTTSPTPFSDHLSSRDQEQFPHAARRSGFEHTQNRHRETPRAAAAFQSYLLLGPDRSLAKLAESLGKKSGYTRQLETWSSSFHWQDRARQYDMQEAEKRRKKRQQELETMDSEHALIGRTHLLRAITAMEPILKNNEAPFPSLVTLFKFSAELERLARGAATSRLEGDVSVVVQPKEYVNIQDDECGSEE